MSVTIPAPLDDDDDDDDDDHDDDDDDDDDDDGGGGGASSIRCTGSSGSTSTDDDDAVATTTTTTRRSYDRVDRCRRMRAPEVSAANPTTLWGDVIAAAEARGSAHRSRMHAPADIVLGAIFFWHRRYE
jgi:hypothetical protein